jgi:hypothetical protein
MTQTTPSRFLSRIAGYPEPVRLALQAEVTEAVLEDHVRVLHDSPPERRGRGGRVELTDTLLSRLVVSRRFLSRAARFLDLLAAPDPAAAEAELAELFQRMVRPLADPAAPYLWKIAEVVGGGREEGAPADGPARALAPLLDLLELHRDLTAPAGSAETGAAETGPPVIRLMRRAAETGRVAALNAALGLLGQPLAFAGRDEADLPAALVAGFLRLMARAGEVGLAGPAPDEAAWLRAIAASQPPGQPERLGGQGGLALRFDPAPEGPDAARWQALCADAALAGLVRAAGEDEAGRLLTLPGTARLPALALVWMALAELPPAGLRLRADPRPPLGGWAARITGYDDALTETAETGRLTVPGPDAGDEGARILMLGRALPDPGAATALPAVPADEAYALILRLAPGPALPGWLNLDGCLVFDGLDALCAAMAGAGARLRRKPVVILGPGSPEAEDHIIASVTRFWAHGGGHAVSPVMLAHDGPTGALLASLPERDRLTTLTPAATTTLPLGLLLDEAETRAAELAAGVLRFPAGLAVAFRRAPGTAAPAEAGPDRLQRDLAARPLPPADHEALFLTGPADAALLARAPKVANWAVEPLMAGVLRRHRGLENLLAAFPAAPSAQAAAAVLEGLEPASAEVAALAGPLDAFARALAGHPPALLALPAEPLVTFLELARHMASADAIGRALAVVADQLCHKDANLVVPLFELLSCTLPRADLVSVLGFAALAVPGGGGGARKHLQRIAECLRRYGGPALMAPFLAAMLREDSPLLADRQFLSCFHELTGTPEAAVLQALSGGALMPAIEATLPFRARFLQAVAAGDRAAMQRLLAEPVADFAGWIDSLRPYGAELRAMGLEGFDAPGLGGLARRKLAAVVFADRSTLAEFARLGYFAEGSDLDAIALNILGDNALLNRRIAARFDGSGLPPYRIAGDSAAAVFAAAAASLPALPASGARAQTGPAVSVILSAYDPDPALLRRSLASVAGQSHAPAEIFVIDDASAPGPAAEIAAIAAEFPGTRHIRLETNLGPYAGRNLALSQARGDFIAIQDADDWSHPGRLAAQLAAFAEAPARMLVSMAHIRIDRAGAVQMEAGFTLTGDGPMSSLYRRQVFDETGPFAAVRSRGDVEMRERIRGYYGGHAICELDAPAMLCLAAPGSLSQKTRSEAREALQLFRDNFTRKPALSALRREGLRPTDLATLVPMALRPPAGGEP